KRSLGISDMLHLQPKVARTGEALRMMWSPAPVKARRRLLFGISSGPHRHQHTGTPGPARSSSHSRPRSRAGTPTITDHTCNAHVDATDRFAPRPHDALRRGADVPGGRPRLRDIRDRAEGPRD